MKTRREITIETDRLLMISSDEGMVLWCDSCAMEVEMIPVDEAAVLIDVSTRSMFHLVEQGRVHYIETAEGLLRICPHSLGQSNWQIPFRLP